MTTDQYISIRSAAKILHVNKETMRRLVRSGRIPVIRVGTHIFRINVLDVEALSVFRKENYNEFSNLNEQRISAIAQKVVYPSIT